MSSRSPRSLPSRSPSALIHRGPQAHTLASHATMATPFHHAPNAALLIDFDNVTMGIRSDLGHELRNLLGSDIIKGKVAVQRAYADWRRYPQYIVPLSESSIDLIFAPAYGSSKKNATDIRLAIDALELVFTRPEIGTFILLSGDSDFSSLVLKLKEYGKYVIGVGIRESSSDLLVQNCDEYYSYNALAGLVKNSEEEEQAKKYDPWELVTEAASRMKRNGDVMRSDRLKQVMQEIDATFDERNLGFAKFSRFCQEAASRGLLGVTKLENGQLDIDLPAGVPATTTHADVAPVVAREETGEEREARRSRRGRGRGRGRDRGEREAAAKGETQVPVERSEEPSASAPSSTPAAPAPSAATSSDDIGSSGERLTRDEAFDLVKRAVAALVSGDDAVKANEVRRKARQILGRDSESLSARFFERILRDAHGADIVDLRRRGEDFEVARVTEAASVAEQLAKAETANAPAAPAPVTGAAARVGVRGRGPTARGALPPGLLTVGIVARAGSPAPAAAPAVPAAAAAPATPSAEPEAVAAPRAKRAAKAPAAKKAASKAAKKSAPAKAVKPEKAEKAAKAPAKKRAVKKAAKAE
ncbi:MAG: hypothetical protein JWO05_613 [Gemmatimonadetes bacterium]|nr:hypothetical protein [Gemmatimonadota bacterium]